MVRSISALLTTYTVLFASSLSFAQPVSQSDAPNGATLAIPLVKRTSSVLIKDDGTVFWDRVQAHIAKTNAKYVQGLDSYLQNLGEPLLPVEEKHIKREPFVYGADLDVAEGILGRRAWGEVGVESDTLEWSGDSWKGRESDQPEESKVFKGFRGSGILGRRENIEERAAANPKFPGSMTTHAFAAARTTSRTAQALAAQKKAAQQSAALAAYQSRYKSKQAAKSSSVSAAKASATSRARTTTTTVSPTPRATTTTTTTAIRTTPTITATTTTSTSTTTRSSPSPSPAPANAGTLPLINEYDGSLWAGYIQIGTPAKPFLIDFDTGSSDLWVPASSCNTGGCVNHAKYDPSQSSSSVLVPNSKLSISYGDGSSSSGPVFSETVSVADFTATSQYFGAASQMSSSFADDPMDGLMGMGYQSISQIGAKPFFQTLMSQGKVPKGQFSFKLGATGASELFLGGMNPASFVSGSTAWTPVTSQSYYVVTSTVSVGGSPIVSNFNAIVDSGTTVIVAPTKWAASFWAGVPGSASYGSGYYTYTCNSPPSITFSFPGSSVQWAMSSATLNLGRASAGSSRCVGSIVGADVGINAVILGDAFMSNMYTTFDLDQNRVGFSNLA